MSTPDAVTTAVAGLGEALPALLEACTDPEATDLAELLLTIREARESLAKLERDTELACAKAMTADQALVPGALRVERTRGSDRKAWDHDDWQRDVRQQALRKLGLAGAEGVVTADGEVLPAGVLHDLLRAVQGVHGAAGPKVTGLRGLGLDVRDYCETSPGAWKVKVLRDTDETEQATEQPAEPDQAA